MVLGKLDRYVQKNETRPPSYITHKNKFKMDLPFYPETPLLGIYLKEPKTLISKNISTPMFIAALFTIAKIRK